MRCAQTIFLHWNRWNFLLDHAILMFFEDLETSLYPWQGSDKEERLKFWHFGHKQELIGMGQTNTQTLQLYYWSCRGAESGKLLHFNVQYLTTLNIFTDPGKCRSWSKNTLTICLLAYSSSSSADVMMLQSPNGNR